MKFLLFSFIFFGVFSHDIQVAYYKIYEDQNLVCVDFVFEKEDIVHTFTNVKPEFLIDTLQTYLQKHFTLRINSQEKILDYTKKELTAKHIHIQGSISSQIQTIKSLEINNTCLLNIEKHSNIIKIRLDKEERDFLMNSERTTITVNY